MSELGTAAKRSGSITVGDKTYTLKPLEMTDWGEFDDWLAGKVMQRAAMAMRLARTPQELEAIHRASQQTAAAMSSAAVFFNTSPEYASSVRGAMFSPEGIVQLGWLSMREVNDGIDLPAVVRIASELDTADQLVGKVLRLAGLLPEPGEEVPSKKKGGQSPSKNSTDRSQS